MAVDTADQARVYHQPMPYRLPPYPRPREPQTSAPVPAAVAMLGRQWADEQEFGTHGAWIQQRDEPPPPAPGRPGLLIEPADWAAEERERAERGEQPVEPEPSVPPAITGVIPYNPEPFGVASRDFVPLTQPVFDPPDWRADEREREKQAAADRAALELARQLQREGS